MSTTPETTAALIRRLRCDPWAQIEAADYFEQMASELAATKEKLAVEYANAEDAIRSAEAAESRLGEVKRELELERARRKAEVGVAASWGDTQERKAADTGELLLKLHAELEEWAVELDDLGLHALASELRRRMPSQALIAAGGSGK